MIPGSLIFADSVLNRLIWSIRKDVTLFAPLTDSLEFMGVESVTFTRNSTSTAVWRDGFTHNVAVNEPRFEYSGDTALGIAITKATETLQYASANGLSNANSLFWLQDAEVLYTPAAANPFNGSGVWIGADAHIRDVIKFSRVLSAVEIALVVEAMGGIAGTPVTPPIGQSTFGTAIISAGQSSVVITHGLSNLLTIVDCTTSWPTEIWWSNKTANSIRLNFTVIPDMVQQLDWGAYT